jgi:hypothetical protein
MLMAGYILQAFEHGGMPMHAAGYRELAEWAADELSAFDYEALQDIRHRVPGALLAIVENALYERFEAACSVDGRPGPGARFACREMLNQYRVRRPS